jgi:hypothetical protein
MTLDEAKQKIINRVLTTTEGWSIEYGECMTTMLTHDSLPGLVVQHEVDCPYNSPKEYSVRLKLSDKTILCVKGEHTDLCLHVHSIFEKAKEEQEILFTSSIIAFAETL